MLKKMFVFLFLYNFIFAFNPVKSAASVYGGVFMGVFPGVTVAFGKKCLDNKPFYYAWHFGRAFGILEYIRMSVPKDGSDQLDSKQAVALALAFDLIAEVVALKSE